MKELQDDLSQEKYNYYRQICVWSVVISSLANVAYLVSDYQLFEAFPFKTVIPRCLMLFISIIYLLIEKRIKDYRVMVPLSYAMIHGIMWCTIWAIYYLPNRIHANEGFIIMQLMFLAVGMAAPVNYSIFFHALLMIDILVSYPINHYENIDLMLSLGIPCVIAIEFLLAVLDKLFIEHFETSKNLSAMLITDNLTGAYNRNIFKSICSGTSNRLIFSNASILILDIDHFKAVNDTYGHNAGDKVLRDLVYILKSRVRKSDYVVRWGGEEFVIILNGAPLMQATLIAEEIRKSIEDFNGEVCKFTVSIGVTGYFDEDYLVAIKRADGALYEAKETGRNKVCSR